MAYTKVSMNLVLALSPVASVAVLKSMSSTRSAAMVYGGLPADHHLQLPGFGVCSKITGKCFSMTIGNGMDITFVASDT